MVTRGGAQRGLTLVEVLIALVLLTALVGILFNGLSLSANGWKKATTRINHSDRWRLVSQFLRREISTALPLRHRMGRDNDLMFDGDAESFQFVGTIPSHLSRGGPRLIQLRRKASADHYQLVFSYDRLDSDMSLALDDFDEDASTTVLLDDLETLSFSYFGSERPDQPGEWRDAWDNDRNLPQLVKIELATTERSVGWPEIIIPVHARGLVNLPQLQLQTAGPLNNGRNGANQPDGNGSNANQSEPGETKPSSRAGRRPGGRGSRGAAGLTRDAHGGSGRDPLLDFSLDPEDI